jgi:predicted phosphodiesterase
MRVGVLADVHGNAVALRAVLDDASRYGVERWWALGDLVVFGPRPAEVLQLLSGLPSIEFVMGNTDRHVVEGTSAFSMAGAGARGVAWTQGVLSQAGMLDWLSGLPASQTLELSGGTRMLGIHASPSSDDGPGIDPDSSDEQLEGLLNGCGAEVVVGGHTHLATDRIVGAIRALNPGSVGLPRRCRGAGWLVVDDEDGLTVEQHVVPFDIDAVISDSHARRYPNADYVESVLTGRHPNAH